MSEREAHPELRIGSAWVALLVLAVALGAGWGLGRWLGRGDETRAPLALTRPAMGTLVEIQVRDGDGPDQRAAVAAAFAEIARVDSLFDLGAPASPADPERLEALREAIEVGRLTDGAFDARMAPLMDLWGWTARAPVRPDPVALAAEVARLSSPPGSAEELAGEPERLHFGAWAKGYAVDRAIATLARLGVREALVNAGGEIRTLGGDWKVGVQHPRLRGALLARLTPGTLAVATSGDYEQFFEADGIRFHHLLDPRTGDSARGCQSVTVLAPSCMRADALATGVFVLGPERGLALVESMPDVECLIVDAAGVVHHSSGLGAHLIAEGERTAP